MKKYVISVLILSFVISPVALAASTDVIKANCDAARSSLQRIITSDKISRINRGRAYDQMSRLFYNFSERLRQNNIDNQKFTELTNEFNMMTASFRANYDIYKSSIDMVIDRECQSRPEAFYDSLQNAREKRRQVEADINSLNEIAERYQLAVNELDSLLHGVSQ